MPLFDIQCIKCKNIQEVITTYVAIMTHPCYNCGIVTPHDILPPLCSMQPDNMWAGAKTDLGYFTSKKEYKDHIKNNNLERATRDNYESVQKNKAKRFETIAKKNKENLTKFIEKEIVHTIDLPNGD